MICRQIFLYYISHSEIRNDSFARHTCVSAMIIYRLHIKYCRKQFTGKTRINISGTYTKYCVIISRAHEVELKRCIFQVTLHIILTPCHGRGDNVSLELQRNDAILSDASLYYVRGSGASIIAGPESESTRKVSEEFSDNRRVTKDKISCFSLDV